MAGNQSRTDKLWADYCANPDRELLRVYADALVEAGDPRGEWINLSLLDAPTPEQAAKRAAMLGKQKKQLAGPGGEYLREFFFGRDGLVALARAEAPKVIAGVDAIAALNPRLVLTITSIKTLKDAVAFGAVSLEKIWFVDFGWITGTHGGMNLNDKQLAAIAPALTGVRHLQLSISGTPEKCFSPAGLRAVLPRLTALRFLAISYYSIGLAPAEEYAAAVAEAAPSLRSFDFQITDAPNARRTSGTGLLVGGRPSEACGRAMNEGREFADQLEAALA